MLLTLVAWVLLFILILCVYCRICTQAFFYIVVLVFLQYRCVIYICAYETHTEKES